MTQRVLEVTFLTRLGHALSAAGDPVSSTERTLGRVARSYGMSDVDISVLPTLVLVRAHDGTAPTIDLAGADVGNDLRLDQVGALYDIVELARLGRISASDGLARLADVWRMPPRFGPAVRILGHVVLSVGLGLILTPRPAALMYCAGLGLLVGVLIELGRRWSTLEVLLPVIASLLVAVLVFVATSAGQVVAPLLAPPFQVLFLPAFWLLVPGVLAVVGLADLVGNEATVALLDLGRVMFTILSVALGVLNASR
jgi:uncharacterized membrane protein YjjP (DUF1212 family)